MTKKFLICASVCLFIVTLTTNNEQH